MGKQGGITAFFESQSDAQRAAEELHDHGIHAETRNSASHGESFWETIKDFFSGHDDRGRYESGSLLLIEDLVNHGETAANVVTRNNGIMSEDKSTLAAGGATVSDYDASPRDLADADSNRTDTTL